jgi:hypothetical protein
MKVLFTLLALLTLLISHNGNAAVAVHGMVIFGKENLYAYHLPMFHKVHNKQMAISFDVSADVKKQITEAEDSKYLTFVPAPFDLDKFIAQPFELKGDVYSGHFEKDGIVILHDVLIKNPKIVFLQELKTADPENKTMDYALVGTVNDIYAIHVINGSQALDQIYKLTTINASDFETAKNYHYLQSYQSLNLQDEYSVTTPPGHCPSRLCGQPGYELASFKVESLYFEDSVM